MTDECLIASLGIYMYLLYFIIILLNNNIIFRSIISFSKR